MHDDMQPIRLYEMDQCFKDGQIPCRWTANLGLGYGYPLYIFYSPLAYYAMEAVHLVGFPILISIKIIFILSFILSGLTMFLLARELWGSAGGFVSAAFYIYAPYHAVDTYVRGAVGEFWALIFLPLVLWAILKCIKMYSKKYALLLALSTAGILLSHNLTFIAFAPTALIWTFLLLTYYKKWRLFPKLMLSILSGVLLSAFYTIPLTIEKPLVHLDSMISGYFNYLAHFATITQLFFSGHWGYGPSQLGPFDNLSLSIGTLHWLLVVASLIILLKSKIYQKNRWLLIIIPFFLTIFTFSIFLTHSRSTFIWQTLDYLKYFQFPWRFLTLTILSASVLAGFPLFVVKKISHKIGISAILIMLVILFNANYFRPQNYIQITDQQKLSGKNWLIQTSASIYDYLPQTVTAPPANQAPNLPEIISGNAQINAFQKGSNWQAGTITAVSSATIQLPLFDYPGFKLLVDNQPTTFNHQNFLGLVSFQVAPGVHTFKISLADSPDRLIADILTIIGLLSLLLYV